MRPPILPDNATLLLLEAAGRSHAQIAEEYDVSRQAVTKRFNDMKKYSRTQFTDVTAILPWDIAGHPLKHKLKQQNSFLGLRAHLRLKLGQEISARSQVSLRAFLGHIDAGEVFNLDETKGAHYVPRDPGRDGSLIIRWPEGVPQDDRTEYFRFVPGQELSTRV